MTTAQEWQILKQQLRASNYSLEAYTNQYYRRLLEVLNDPTATPVDQLLAYRDALLATSDTSSRVLPSSFDRTLLLGLANQCGLGMKVNGDVCVTESTLFNNLDLGPIYSLDQRRFIHKAMLDPALQVRLKDPNYTDYNGLAQQVAVRLAITEPRQSTIIVNLPTGCGKTLVAHAVTLFESRSLLTLVIVPTTGLAIEQGLRVQKLLKMAGRDHGGLYYWHGGQTKEQHDDIKRRILEQRQTILFCSPEAACRSLLPTLFKISAGNSLGTVVIDEAHIVDQWGTEFRPYFQIIASLVRSLRRISREGIKCLLMSATFTEKSMQLVQELFGIEGQECIHVNGAFLRPEIQYHVVKVSEEEHIDRVLDAVVALPKPMIIYVLSPDHASQLYRAIGRFGVGRLGLFTGKTSTIEREELIRKWSHRELDIMVANSAFGLGMDKNDIRSVVHAAVPENLDRFYQEVGRGGRDGLASQSLLICFEKQFEHAKRLNRERLITVDLGYRKWKAMWQNGVALPDGKRRIEVSSLRTDQQHLTEGNQEWNWRTILLMQRVGLIRIELEEPSLPSIDPLIGAAEYRDTINNYYNKYYEGVTVTPTNDEHLDKAVWDSQTRQRREFEKSSQLNSFNVLENWIRNSLAKPLCNLLSEYYTLEGVQPEYACGGCPSCLSSHSLIESPTLGRGSDVSGLCPTQQWQRPLCSTDIHKNIYFSRKDLTTKQLVRSWSGWLRRLIELRAIKIVYAEVDVLSLLNRELKTGVFWIGEPLVDGVIESDIWPTLILQTNLKASVASVGMCEAPVIFMAPEDLEDPINKNRKWWQAKTGSVSLNNFLLGIQ